MTPNVNIINKIMKKINLKEKIYFRKILFKTTGEKKKKRMFSLKSSVSYTAR